MAASSALSIESDARFCEWGIREELDHGPFRGGRHQAVILLRRNNDDRGVAFGDHALAGPLASEMEQLTETGFCFVQLSLIMGIGDRHPASQVFRSPSLCYKRNAWTTRRSIRKYTDFDEMKADEYRYWQSRPAHERLDAVEEMIETAYALKGWEIEPDVPRLQRPFVRLPCPWR